MSSIHLTFCVLLAVFAPIGCSQAPGERTGSEPATDFDSEADDAEQDEPASAPAESERDDTERDDTERVAARDAQVRGDARSRGEGSDGAREEQTDVTSPTTHAAEASMQAAPDTSVADLARLFGDGGLLAPKIPGPPSPDNPKECPPIAPDNPIGSCIGVPVYATCTYGTYSCLCDWVHWLCI